ncbi:hypothetical protein [Sporosarcina sp. E16_8]|uniref:hypothetical protein n=1 Tax=Sporosarcina sp. E16_8 TaxID=2789295 RepID=UPI001A915677|nr:hypothetical protein [Sporosarcina sp. E16_8]MBO0589252.1 hypothetical protein [Sporosarcina sp. E16_8]
MEKAYGLLALMSTLLLFACSQDTINTNSGVLQEKVEQKVTSKVTDTENKVNYQIPFKINKIESEILNLNDSASEVVLKGVRYELFLFSKEKIPEEKYLSYEFEIDANSPLKESLGPIDTLTLAETLSDGYLYTLSFGTIYREHTQAELDAFNQEHDFNILVNYEGVKYQIEKQ